MKNADSKVSGDAKITSDVQAQLSQHDEIGPRVHVQTLNGSFI